MANMKTATLIKIGMSELKNIKKAKKNMDDDFYSLSPFEQIFAQNIKITTRGNIGKYKVKNIVVGMGEVGKAVYKVLGGDTYSIDKKETLDYTCEILHICIPYSSKFVSQVKAYQKKYQPKYTIVYSTVKVGTCRKLGAIHSPVVGLHPYLAKSIRTFTRFLAGEKASEIADFYRRLGLHVYLFDKPEATEIMKMEDTTLYGVCIEHAKHMKKRLEKEGISYEAWTIYTQMYNEGYQKLGYPEYTRPNLVPIMQKISGHCVLPNLELQDTEFTRFLKKLND